MCVSHIKEVIVNVIHTFNNKLPFATTQGMKKLTTTMTSTHLPSLVQDKTLKYQKEKGKMAHLLQNIELQAKVQVLNFQCLSILCLLESHNDMDLQHNHLGAENIITTIVRV
jgi:hypothetical protein